MYVFLQFSAFKYKYIFLLFNHQGSMTDQGNSFDINATPSPPTTAIEHILMNMDWKPVGLAFKYNYTRLDFSIM